MTLIDVLLHYGLGLERDGHGAALTYDGARHRFQAKSSEEMTTKTVERRWEECQTAYRAKGNFELYLASMPESLENSRSKMEHDAAEYATLLTILPKPLLALLGDSPE